MDDISEIKTFHFIFGNWLVILSLLCLAFWVTGKYDLSLAFSLLGVILCGFLIFLEASFVVYPAFTVLYTAVCVIFAASSAICYRYYTEIFRKEKQARVAAMQYYQIHHPRRERFSKQGLVSILLVIFSV